MTRKTFPFLNYEIQTQWAKINSDKRLKARNAEIHHSSVTSADILNDKIITVDSGDLLHRTVDFQFAF